MKKYMFKEYAQETFPVFPDETYEEQMQTTVEPYLDSIRESFLLTVSGTDQKIYGELYRNPALDARGTLVISHGFTESTAKYAEVIYYILKEGYHAAIIDHRGHGFSRSPKETNIAKQPTHVDHFQDYLNDFHAVIEKKILPNLPGPYYLYGHSMGGCIAATYLEQHPDIFSKAILNAPMCEINRGGLPKYGSLLFTALSRRLGKGKRFMVTQGGFTGEYDYENSVTNSECRYRYYLNKQLSVPEYQSGGASFSWSNESLKAGIKLLKPANCKRIKIPVLLFQAEKDVLVLPHAQEKLISQIEDGTLVVVEDAKHEIYMSGGELASHYFAAVFSFLKN